MKGEFWYNNDMKHKGGQSMKVVKKDGRLQEFDLNKIVVSIQRASDDIHQPINYSDSKTIALKIEAKLRKLYPDSVSSHDIHDNVIESLENCGFHSTAHAYHQASLN